MDFESGRTRGDRQPLITELADDVERFAWRLFQREPELVRGDRTLDFGSHVCGRFEEAIGGYQSVECLVRTLEVVVTDEVVEAVLRIDDVREYRATEKLVPQRLPETLDLTERLWMLRSAADVLHGHACEQLFKLGLAAPHRVLTTVVGQHLGRCAVCGDATLEGLHHQRGLLVMRE